MSRFHARILNDEARIAAFERAIKAAVGPDDVVVDLGSGVGTYAAFAAQAGSRRVFGVESGPVAELSRRLVERNGLDVEILHADARDISLPELATVLIFEDFSVALLAGHARELLDSVQRRWMAPGFRMIPSGVRLNLAPVASAAARRATFPLEAQGDQVHGLDVRLIRESLENTPCQVHGLTDFELRSRPAEVLAVDLYEGIPPRWRSQASFEIESRGAADGLCLWMDLQLDEDTSYSNHPLGNGVWGQFFFPFPASWSAEVGDRLTCELRFERARGEGYWAWTAALSHGGETRHDCRANSFAASALTPERLQRYSPDRVVTLNARAQQEATVLSLVDGRRTTRELAAQARELLHLEDDDAALALVLEVLERRSLN